MHTVAGVRCVRRSVRVAHLFAVAVVRGDQRFAVKLEKFCDNSGTTSIHCLHRFDAGLDHTGVTHHVGICQIQNDQVVVSHAGEHFIADFKRAHLGFQIVRRNFW